MNLNDSFNLSVDNQIGAFSIENADKKDFRNISDFYITFKIEINKDFFLGKNKKTNNIGSERVILREPRQEPVTSISKDKSIEIIENRCSILNTSIDEYNNKALQKYNSNRNSLQPKQVVEEFKFSMPGNRRSSHQPNSFNFGHGLNKKPLNKHTNSQGVLCTKQMQISLGNVKPLPEPGIVAGGSHDGINKTILKTSIHNIMTKEVSEKKGRLFKNSGFMPGAVQSNIPNKRSKFAFPDDPLNHDPILTLNNNRIRNPISKPKFCLNVNNIDTIPKESPNDPQFNFSPVNITPNSKNNLKLSGTANVSSMDEMKPKPNKFFTPMGLYDEKKFQEKTPSPIAQQDNTNPSLGKKLEQGNLREDLGSMNNNMGQTFSPHKSPDQANRQDRFHYNQANAQRGLSGELLMNNSFLIPENKPTTGAKDSFLKNFSMVPKISLKLAQQNKKEIPRSAQGKRKPSLGPQKPRLDSNIRHMNLRNYKTIVSLKSEMQLRSKQNYKKQQRQIIQIFHDKTSNADNNPFQGLVLKSSSTIESVDSCDAGALKLDKKYCALCGDDFRYSARFIHVPHISVLVKVN